MRWPSQLTRSPKHHPGCHRNYTEVTPGSKFCSPRFASSQASPVWGPTPAKSYSFSPHCSTQSSVNWIDDRFLCAKHMDTIWFLYGLSLSPAMTSVIGPSSDLENRLETHNTGCDGKAYFFFLLEMAHERSDQGSERP